MKHVKLLIYQLKIINKLHPKRSKHSNLLKKYTCKADCDKIYWIINQQKPVIWEN